MATSAAKTLELTPLDNFLPQLTNYALKLLFFPTADVDREVITQQMRHAFIRTLDAIPWLAGTVVQVEDKIRKGRLAVGEPRKSVDELLSVNVLDNIDYAALKAQHFPVSSLDTNKLWQADVPVHRPTIEAQLNFVNGGLILAIRMAHEVADGHGLSEVCNVWAAYCRDEDGSLLLGPDAFDRGRLMKGRPGKLSEHRFYTRLRTDQIKGGIPHDGLLRRLSRQVSSYFHGILISTLRLVSDFLTYRSIRTTVPEKTHDEAKAQVEIMFVPAARLRELKSAVIASHHVSRPQDDGIWVSTHDVISALLWCSVTNVWKQTHSIDLDSNPSPYHRLLYQALVRTTQPISILAIFINARRVFHRQPLQSYLGNCVLAESVMQPFGSFSTSIECVSQCAYKIRQIVQKPDEDSVMRLMGALDAEPDMRKVVPDAGPFPQSTMLINSWADFKYYRTDWGLIGRCDRVRAWPLLRYPYYLVLPRLDTADGWGEDEAGLEILLYTDSKLLSLLKEDSLLNHFVSWRGG